MRRLLPQIGILIFLFLFSWNSDEILSFQDTAIMKVSDSDNADCDFSHFKPLRVTLDPKPNDHVIKPTYPKEAMQLGIQGTVIVRVLIGLDGKVLKACPQKGPALLLKSAKVASLNSTFAPVLINEQPRYVERTLVFRFVLAGDASDTIQDAGNSSD
jgi:hypothetical protein